MTRTTGGESTNLVGEERVLAYDGEKAESVLKNYPVSSKKKSKKIVN